MAAVANHGTGQATPLFPFRPTRFALEPILFLILFRNENTTMTTSQEDGFTHVFSGHSQGAAVSQHASADVALRQIVANPIELGNDGLKRTCKPCSKSIFFKTINNKAKQNKTKQSNNQKTDSKKQPPTWKPGLHPINDFLLHSSIFSNDVPQRRFSCRENRRDLKMRRLHVRLRRQQMKYQIRGALHKTRADFFQALGLNKNMRTKLRAQPKTNLFQGRRAKIRNKRDEIRTMRLMGVNKVENMREQISLKIGGEQKRKRKKKTSCEILALIERSPGWAFNLDWTNTRKDPLNASLERALDKRDKSQISGSMTDTSS